MKERKDRWVSNVTVVIMGNDQGSVVVVVVFVVAVVLQGKRQGKAHHYQKCLIEWVSFCQLC